MDTNIVVEIYNLKVGLMQSLSQSALPATIKSMIVNEIALSMKAAEQQEIRSLSIKPQTESVEKDKEAK